MVVRKTPWWSTLLVAVGLAAAAAFYFHLRIRPLWSSPVEPDVPLLQESPLPEVAPEPGAVVTKGERQEGGPREGDGDRRPSSEAPARPE